MSLQRDPSSFKLYRCNSKTDDDVNKGNKFLKFKEEPEQEAQEVLIGKHKIDDDITINAVVTHIVNPQEFYVRYATVKNESKSGSVLHCRMQEFYNDPINASNYQLKTGQVYPKRKYVCKVNQKFGLKSSWEICEINSANLKKRLCRITIPNISTKIRLVSFYDIYELNPDFQEFHDKQIQCSLVDVQPPTFPWPKESIEGFKKLALWREFYCHISLVSDAENDDDLPILRANVVLLGKNADSTINTQLCYKGLAISSGPSSARYDADPKNELVFNIEKPKHSTKDASAKVEKFPHFYEEWLTDKKFVKEFFSQVPKKIQTKLGMYWLPVFLSPGSFYALEFHQLPALYKMMTELTIQLEKCPDDHEYVNMSEGDFVGVRYNNNQSVLYYRAVIKEIVSYEKIKLLLIDFGFSCDAVGADFKLLPMDFLQIPSFAKRFHLNLNNLKPSNNLITWSSRAINLCKTFDKQKQKEKSSIIHFFNSDPKNNTIKLKEFNQKVIYNHIQNKWEVGSLELKEEQKKFNDIGQHHPLLMNLFQSIGVDIGYQDKSSFDVIKMSSLLKDAGYA